MKEQYIDGLNRFDLYIADLKSILGFMQNAHVTAYDLSRTAMTSMAGSSGAIHLNLKKRQRW
ncbi:hypothetical protein ACIFQM_06730 [Paenibacillus sp. NRS-1782]|uniref:hypothetical protein n=1 Tax=unclassified Paenibacillus TaxID=185978 RepID=UPI003D2C8D5F